MHLLTVIAWLASSSTVLGSPIQPVQLVPGEPGHVTDASGKQYELYNTGNSNIRAITDKTNGEFMKPISYNVSSNHVCKFWSESTRGVGYFIGEFHGPVAANFNADWAAFFECWEDHHGHVPDFHVSN